MRRRNVGGTDRNAVDQPAVDLEAVRQVQAVGQGPLHLVAQAAVVDPAVHGLAVPAVLAPPPPAVTPVENGIIAAEMETKTRTRRESAVQPHGQPKFMLDG